MKVGLTTATIIYEFKNNSSKLAVSLNIDGRGVAEWDIFDAANNSGRKIDICRLAYWRYYAVKRIREMARAIASLTGGTVPGEMKNESFFCPLDITKWKVAALSKGTANLKVEFPLPKTISPLQEDSYFMRVLECGADVGLVSKIAPLAVSGNKLYGEIPLRGKNTIVAKIFSIDGTGRSISLFSDKVPFGVALDDPSFTEDAVRSAVRKAEAPKLLCPAKLPKVFVATMCEFTDVVFARILAHSVNRTNSYFSAIGGYFRKVPLPLNFGNFEINLDQGAAIVQISYIPDGPAMRSPEVIRRTHARAVKLCEEAGVGAIEINFYSLMGVHGGGASMMAEPELCRIIVSAVAHAAHKKMPILVKMRTGLDPEHKNAADIAEIAEQAGADAVIVMAQTAHGPADQPFDYETVREVKRRVKIPVIVNGGIRNFEEAKAVLLETGADGIMLGKACLFDPTIVRRTEEYLSSGRVSPPPTPQTILETAKYHLALAADYYGQDFDFDQYILQFTWGYMTNIFPALRPDKQKAALKALIDIDDIDELRLLFDSLDKDLRKTPTDPPAIQ
jgi:tRNA-dihydrouridine synthase